MNYLLLEAGKDTASYLITNIKAKNVFDFIKEFIKEDDCCRLGTINVESRYYSHDIPFEFGEAHIPVNRYVLAYREDGSSYFELVPLRLQDFRINKVRAEDRWGTWLVYVEAEEIGEDIYKQQ